MGAWTPDLLTRKFRIGSWHVWIQRNKSTYSSCYARMSLLGKMVITKVFKQTMLVFTQLRIKIMINIGAGSWTEAVNWRWWWRQSEQWVEDPFDTGNILIFVWIADNTLVYIASNSDSAVAATTNSLFEKCGLQAIYQNWTHYIIYILNPYKAISESHWKPDVTRLTLQAEQMICCRCK